MQAQGDAPGQLSGMWKVVYESGAVRTYVFHDNGTVHFVEEARRCVMSSRTDLILAFNDGKLERISVSDGELHVEQWDPGAGYPNGRPLKGVGLRVCR